MDVGIKLGHYLTGILLLISAFFGFDIIWVDDRFSLVMAAIITTPINLLLISLSLTLLASDKHMSLVKMILLTAATAFGVVNLILPAVLLGQV